MMKDTLRDQGKRKLLVQELQEKKGIDNVNVLKAIGNVPRHLFFDKVFGDFLKITAVPKPNDPDQSH